MDRLWTDYANSKWRDWKGDGHTEEELFDEQWQHSFLNRYSFVLEKELSLDEMPFMLEVRDNLIKSAHHLFHHQTLSDEEMSYYNEILGRKHLQPVLRKQTESGYELNYNHRITGWSDIIHSVLLDFAKTLAEEDIGRIRLCTNPNCQWIFYDETRNRRQQYCDDKLCGNLMKVRRFRARQKEDSQDE
ncbi:CGNR zinc finger domain-containing protein [Paenibacillus sp. Marseille-Q4541]|uniref:CGNR zinc finger domain-containing protein n=1 Tax=Paenibacillus sp. Marseille-Q4541 TaxID=2831522 RepID=UPI001BA62142|nr:CGNR zinc finger domain-containing protein [Paenibacillus sp. Marseille-Q4541]